MTELPSATVIAGVEYGSAAAAPGAAPGQRGGHAHDDGADGGEDPGPAPGKDHMPMCCDGVHCFPCSRW